MKVTIFYSWQSDLPNNTNRGFIERALNKAVESIKAEAEMVIDPCVERDVQGETGTPDIAHAIFRKIDKCRIFVGDVSIINPTATTDRKTPNPNVLLELGYAAKMLTWDYVICVYNTAFGSVKDLPFDLLTKLMCVYSVTEEEQNKSDERGKLASKLKSALVPILTRLAVNIAENSKQAKGTIQLTTHDWRLQFMHQNACMEYVPGDLSQATHADYSFELEAFNTGESTVLRNARVLFMQGDVELHSDTPRYKVGHRGRL